MEKVFSKTLKVLLMVLVIFMIIGCTNKIFAATNTKQYTVTYYGRITNVSNLPAKQTYNAGSTVKISSQIPTTTKEGYVFKGWSTSVLSNKVTYPANTSNTITGIKKNINLYAVWYVKVKELKLSASSKTLTSGKTYKLIKTIKPINASNKAVTYKSSDSGVATVDKDGKITAKTVKEETKVTITATPADGAAAKTCIVTVKPVKVKSVKLNRTLLILNEGNSKQIKATVYGTNLKKMTDKTVTFISNNPSVADVDANGNIQAKQKGETTIIATVKGTNITAKCKVTVKKPIIDVKNISLSINPDKSFLTVGDKATLTATVTPTNATNKTVKFNVTRGNNTVIKITTSGNTATIQAIGEGTAKIKAKCGIKYKTYTVIVKANSEGNSSTNKYYTIKYYSYGSQEPAKCNIEYNKKYKLMKAYPTKNFYGWSTSKTSKTRAYEGGAEVCNKNLTLYALYKKDGKIYLYNEFNENNTGTSDDNSSNTKKYTIKYYYEKDLDEPSIKYSDTCELKKIGGNFAGWTTSKTNKKVEYKGGAIVENKNLVLYALYKTENGSLIYYDQIYRINYFANYGQFSDEETLKTVEINYENAGVINKPNVENPTRKGYTFIGWNTDSRAKSRKDK